MELLDIFPEQLSEQDKIRASNINFNMNNIDNFKNKFGINTGNFRRINSFKNVLVGSGKPIQIKINQRMREHFSNINNLEGKIDSIANLFIVPGDIIFLSHGKTVPCDCLILDGYCSVVESYLTGESNTILKEALPKNLLKFSYENKKSILFHGTDIIKCESSYYENGNNYIKCLVINTGFNTYWGSFLQNILFPKKMNFNFYREMKIFTFVMIFLYFFSVGLSIFFFISYKQSDSYKNLIHTSEEVFKENLSFFYELLDLITIVIPPTFYICMNVASFYFNEILKKKNITCLSEKRLNAAGKVNVIVLDKTGTLTMDGLEISGFQTTVVKNNLQAIDNEWRSGWDTNNKVNFKKNVNLANHKIENEESNENENVHNAERHDTYSFDAVEKNVKLYNSMHMEFWMRFSTENKNSFYTDYQKAQKNNPIYFIECLATCLSIDKLRDNNILGNTMDRELFRYVGWELEKIDEKWHNMQVIIFQHSILNFLILICLKIFPFF